MERSGPSSLGSRPDCIAAAGWTEYAPITDDEALEAFQICTRLEGIIPALESAHGLAQVMKVAPTMQKDQTIVLCLSGRGDKDVESVGRYLGHNK